MDASRQPKAPRNTRKILIGYGMVLLGFVLGYFFFYRKIEEMKMHETFSYSMKGLLLVPLCIVFGVYYIIFTPAGAGAWKDLTPREKPYFIGALVLVALITGVLAYWFQTQLTAYGYQ
ncbi:MAG: hypothetical protein ABIO53_13165 [Chitinophagaceae bacterium]